MAAAPAPFPEGDARNAKYFENLAQLEHQKGLAEAEDKRGREEAENAFKYNTAQLQRQEPIALRNNMSRANTEGILQSGILAGRQGQTQTQYAQREHTVGEARRKAVEAFNRADQRAREGYEQGSHKALLAAQEEAKAALQANPPAFQATPVNPGGTRVNTGLPGTGGVQPYEETSKAGSVRVGEGDGRALALAPTSRNPAVRARQEAIRKALGVG